MEGFKFAAVRVRTLFVDARANLEGLDNYPPTGFLRSLEYIETSHFLLKDVPQMSWLLYIHASRSELPRTLRRLVLHLESFDS